MHRPLIRSLTRTAFVALTATQPGPSPAQPLVAQIDPRVARVLTRPSPDR